jgi:hypothetical protein
MILCPVNSVSEYSSLQQFEYNFGFVFTRNLPVCNETHLDVGSDACDYVMDRLK